MPRLIAFILTITTTLAFGQEPDKVYLNSGVSLSGKIRNDQNNELTYGLYFTDQNGESRKYLPNEITEFCFSDKKCFESIEWLNNGELEYINFQKIVVGEITLYVLNERNNSRFFVRKSGMPLVELIETFSEIDNSKLSNREYARTLASLLEYDPSLSDELKNADLRLKDLIEVIVNHHERIGGNLEIFRYRNNTELQPFAFVGLSRFMGLQSSTGFRGGLELKLLQPEVKRSLVFYFGLYYRTDPYVIDSHNLLFPINMGLKVGSRDYAPELYFGLVPEYYRGLDFNNESYSGFYVNTSVGLRSKVVRFEDKSLYVDLNKTSDVLAFSLGFGF